MIANLNWCPVCKLHLPEKWTHCLDDHRAVLQKFECVPIEETAQHTLAVGRLLSKGLNMLDELMEKWLEYYDDNGLSWLHTSHQAAIKQAFFAGAEAVEHPLALDGAGVCEKCGTRSVLWKCRVCGHDNRPASKA